MKNVPKNGKNKMLKLSTKLIFLNDEPAETKDKYPERFGFNQVK
jgi:hypothetical protein